MLSLTLALSIAACAAGMLTLKAYPRLAWVPFLLGIMAAIGVGAIVTRESAGSVRMTPEIRRAQSVVNYLKAVRQEAESNVRLDARTMGGAVPNRGP